MGKASTHFETLPLGLVSTRSSPLVYMSIKSAGKEIYCMSGLPNEETILSDTETESIYSRLKVKV